MLPFCIDVVNISLGGAALTASVKMITNHNLSIRSQQDDDNGSYLRFHLIMIIFQC